MEENFQLQIISPEKVIFSGDTKMVVLPSYEGDMSILKNHISIITFLRPGIIKIYKSEVNSEDFFVKDGTVEYFNDNLTILSSSVINVKDISKEFINDLIENTQEKLKKEDITDHDRYVLNHQLDVIKEIRV